MAVVEKKRFKVTSIKSKASYLSKKYGGKWKYDGMATWWCDDGKRSVSRTANIWYDINGCDHYGPSQYYLYGDGTVKTIVWGA